MGLIKFILESDNRRNLKRLEKMAQKIDAMSATYEKMTDAELQGQTALLKARLANGETLDDILPEAFATCREASARVLGMKPFFVQLVGGISLHQGRVAEMKTGEGKTLVATLPAYLNALSGNGVHVVTVNDYLAKHQAEWMGKLYNFLGLSVGVIVPMMETEERRAAYACDITYATNNELGFDYLRDNLCVNLEDKTQRGLNFAIVDEVDSILIDEARTPLIISGRGGESSELYVKSDRFVKTLVKDEDFELDEKEIQVHITESGVAKAEKFFGLDDLSDVENTDLNHNIQQALKANHIFHRDADYIVEDKEVIIVDEFTGRLMIGRRYSDGLHQAIEAKEGVPVRAENKTVATITFQNLFRLYKKLSGMTGTAKTEEEEFNNIYGLDVTVIPTNLPMIRVDENDVIYPTRVGKLNAVIKEIQEIHATGRPILVGTTTVEASEEISALLLKSKIKHNVLNAKNHAKEAEIVAQAGRLGSVTIATNMAGRGTDILLGGNPEFLAKRQLLDHQADPEKLSVAMSFMATDDEETLELREKFHELVANFKKDTDEDKKKVVELGGLHIIGTERHESRRIDNQLRGRAGRQGDPGSSRFYISLEDDLARRFGGEQMQRVYEAFKLDDNDPISLGILTKRIEGAQQTIEGRNFGIRKHILEYDDVMNKQRAVMYAERDKVLAGTDIHGEIVGMIKQHLDLVFNASTDGKNPDIKSWNFDEINRDLEEFFLPAGTGYITREMAEQMNVPEIYDALEKHILEEYEERVKAYEEQGVEFKKAERNVLLWVIDRQWTDHIDAMDQLRRSIGLRAYGQHDPVVAYKQEGFEMFEDMTLRIREETVKTLMKARFNVIPERKQSVSNIQAGQEGQQQRGGRAKSQKTVGRNDPCPCGSGKKFKHCCGR